MSETQKPTTTPATLKPTTLIIPKINTAGILKIRSVIQKVSNTNDTDDDQDSSVLELSDYKIEDNFNYKKNITVEKEQEQIKENLEILNQRVNQYSEHFLNDNYKKQQSDLASRVQNAIQNNIGVEHMYFIRGKYNNLYVVRQFYCSREVKFLFNTRKKYYLQQFIYIVEANLDMIVKFLGFEQMKDKEKKHVGSINKKVSESKHSDSEEDESDEDADESENTK